MKIFKTLFLLLCSLPHLLFAKGDLQTDLSLPYLVQQPKIKSAHPPVLILMHGYGSNEADLFDLKDNLPQNFLIISLRATMPMGNNSYQWFGMEMTDGKMLGNRKDIANSVAKIKAMIPAIIKKYKADAAQVYLSGFSQGGMMSYEVGLTAPELFKGIAPLSGKIFEPLKVQIKNTPSLKKLRIFIGHGDADERVAYSFATEANKYLKQMNLNPEFHTYKGMAHSINQQEIADLSKWLSKP
ncbi:MAG: dienelactone hydrolase family protein [Chitinophagaceae bacterium]|jgi:phospholipase/carboxylesterase